MFVLGAAVEDSWLDQARHRALLGRHWTHRYVRLATVYHNQNLGTIVAIEYIMQRLVHGQECAAMNELLKMLRNQRAYSIQNDLQYLYVHRVILCYFFDKHGDRHGYLLDVRNNKEKYAKFIEEYNQATQ